MLFTFDAKSSIFTRAVGNFFKVWIMIELVSWMNRYEFDSSIFYDEKEPHHLMKTHLKKSCLKRQQQHYTGHFCQLINVDETKSNRHFEFNLFGNNVLRRFDIDTSHLFCSDEFRDGNDFLVKKISIFLK